MNYKGDSCYRDGEMGRYIKELRDTVRRNWEGHIAALRGASGNPAGKKEYYIDMVLDRETGTYVMKQP